MFEDIHKVIGETFHYLIQYMLTGHLGVALLAGAPPDSKPTCYKVETMIAGCVKQFRLNCHRIYTQNLYLWRVSMTCHSLGLANGRMWARTPGPLSLVQNIFYCYLLGPSSDPR